MNKILSLVIFIALSCASVLANAASISASPGWWGPTTISGSGFIVNPDIVDILPTITVQIIDPNTNQTIVSRKIRPTPARYNIKTDKYFGGGTFLTSFSVDELGIERHSQCASLVAKATSTTGETALAYFWLPSCLN